MSAGTTRSTLVAQLADWPKKCDPHQPWLVGFSGGKDSVALTELLLALGYEQLILVHAHHHLRGSTADDDAAWAERYAAARGLTFRLCHLHVTEHAERKKISTELAARRLRYEAFAAQATAHGAHGLFLGHQADDQAETVLFRLLRGTGPRGLGGMSAESTDASGLQLLRPLLPITRAQIDTLIAEEDWGWREDASNLSEPYTRNLLRHQLLPLAEKIMQRDPRPLLCQTAQHLTDEDAWMTTLTHEWLTAHGYDQRTLAVKPLAAAPLALQRRLIYRWLTDQRIPLLSWTLIESVRQLIIATTPACTNLPGGFRARRRAGQLFIDQPSSSTDPA
jgi:tRNA(Ile)-lysidine synthase